MAFLVSLLAACGGGGGGSATPSTPISGVAATGAPLAGATITVTDSTGALVDTRVAAADGSFTLAIPATARPPFVVKATLGETTLYSPAATANQTANVTPLTNLVASMLSPTGDPAALGAEIQQNSTLIGTTTVALKANAIVTALQPLLSAAQDTITNPITGAFSANGSGHDLVLNALNVDIKPAGTSANIVVTVKTAVDEASTDQAPSIPFTSNSVPAASLPAMTTSSLPAQDSDTLISNFLARMQNCMALPAAQRTSNGSVVSPVCLDLFSGDNPANYQNQGRGVGPQADFFQLFNTNALNVKFDLPAIDFLRTDGRILASARTTATDGTVGYVRFWLVRENGVLKAKGDGLDNTFTVRAEAEFREFLNAPQRNYYATGFNVFIPNTQVNNLPKFDRVVVTTPNGKQVVLKPKGGVSYLVLVTPNGLTGTSVVRLAGKYADPATTGSPRQLNEGLFWALNPNDGSQTDWSDADIEAIKNVGRWKAEFFLRGNATATPDSTQYTLAFTRPPTIAELRVKKWATLTSTARSEIVGASSATGSINVAGETFLDISAAGNTPAWTIPALAFEPTLVQVQGRYTANATTLQWTDSTNVPQRARTAQVFCSNQGAQDQHCSNGAYASSAVLTLLQLFAYDRRGMEYMSNFFTNAPQ